MAEGPLTGAESDGAWLSAFEAVAERVRRAVEPLLGTEAGRQEHGVGAGGDRTVEVDRLAESAALEELGRRAARGMTCSVLSEEAGLVDLGADYPRVLLDPVDGSLNAKQGLPTAAVMLTLLDGPSLDHVRLGWVLDLGTGVRWHAVRGGGAFRDGEPVRPLPPRRPERLQLVGLECRPRELAAARPLVERAGKLRILGCMALSLAHTASGGIEVFCSPMRVRLFDMTAGMLMIREVGGLLTDMEGRSLADRPAGLESRSTLLGSAHPALHRLALEALGADRTPR